MGSSYRACCRCCGNRFTANEGGGRHWEQLRCPRCGAQKIVGHEQVREAVHRLNQLIDETDNEQAVETALDQYRQDVLTVAGACGCGGKFTFNAPIRCPACSSTDIDLGPVWRLYD